MKTKIFPVKEQAFPMHIGSENYNHIYRVFLWFMMRIIALCEELTGWGFMCGYQIIAH